MNVSPKKRLARRIFKGFAALAMLCLLGVAVLLVSLWLERRSQITLPAPSGAFAVGGVINEWTDDARLDALARVPETKGELLFWIWYPTAGGKSVATDDYVPPQRRAAAGPASGPWSLLTRDASRVHGH